MTNTPEHDQPGAQPVQQARAEAQPQPPIQPHPPVHDRQQGYPQHPGAAQTQETTPLEDLFPQHDAPASTTAQYSQAAASAQAAPSQQSAQSPQGAFHRPEQHTANPFGTSAPGQGAAPEAKTAPQGAQPKSRGGALLAGLALGALLGGVVGGGVAAIVASNASTQTVAQSSAASPIKLDGADTATQISGVAAAATPSVVTLQVSSSSASGSGSGVVYREDGYIITNAHVVTLDGAASDPQVRVKLSDGRILDGTVVGTAPYADLAVVKVDAEGLPAISVADSDALNVGDLTVAIGAPLNLANTVTSGVVSALNRGISVGSALVPQDGGQSQDGGRSEDGGTSPWDFRFGLPNETEAPQQSRAGTVTLPVIQTDASINPGNSGGALLNGKGELIGVNVAIASPTSSDGVASSAGLGFAIPANLATRVADEIIAGEQPSHGLLGATVADSTQDTDADANHAGGLLVDVTRGGAADEAGLRSGDVITAVDGVPAVDGTSVSALVRMHTGGSTVTISYTREGKPAETEATLGTLEW